MKNRCPCANRAGLGTSRNHRSWPLPVTESRLWTSRLDGAATRLRSLYPRPSTSVFHRWRKQSTPIRGPAGVFLFLPAVPGHPTKPFALRAWLKTLEITANPSSRWGRAGRSRGFRTPSFDRSRLLRALSAFRMRVLNGPVLRQHGSADGSGMPFTQWPALGVRGGERDPGSIQTARRLPPEGHCRDLNFNLNNSNKLK